MNHSVDYQHIKTTKNICSAFKKVSRLAALDIFSDFGASFFGKQPENGIKLSTLLATLSLVDGHLCSRSHISAECCVA